MIPENEHHLAVATMLLEFAMNADSVPLDKCGLEKIGVPGLVRAAHSFVQAASRFTEVPPDEYAQSVLAKVRADLAIEDAMYRGKP